MSDQHDGLSIDADSPPSPPPSENRPGTSQGPSAVKNIQKKRTSSDQENNPNKRTNSDRGPVDPVCCRRNNCFRKISVETRTRLRREYNEQLEISTKRGRTFIRKFMLHSPVKCRRGHSNRRNATYQYRIPNGDEEDLEVCMNAFLLVFDIKERGLRNARNETEGLPILQQIQTKSDVDSAEDTNQQGISCSCINAKSMCFQSNSVQTLDEFKVLTDWNLYQIHDRTLTILFDEGFDGMLSLQSILEDDLTIFRENKDPAKTIKMAQLTMLRRFVQCLNCSHHKPHCKEQEQSENMEAIGSGLSVIVNHQSSVGRGKQTSTSTVEHLHSGGSASLSTSTSLPSPVTLPAPRTSVSESVPQSSTPPSTVDYADGGSALGATDVSVHAVHHATLPSESAYFQSNPGTNLPAHDNDGASTSQQLAHVEPPRIILATGELLNPPSTSSLSSFDLAPSSSLGNTQEEMQIQMLHKQVQKWFHCPTCGTRSRTADGAKKCDQRHVELLQVVTNHRSIEDASVIANTTRISRSTSISSPSELVASSILELLSETTSVQSPPSLATLMTTLPRSSLSQVASSMPSVSQVSLPQTIHNRDVTMATDVSSDGGLDILSMAASMAYVNSDLTHTTAESTDIYERLYNASESGNIGEVWKCLQLGAQVTSKHGLDQDTPLHLAALKGHHEVCKLLLQAHAEVNARAQDHDTPLHLAALEGHHEVCKLLLQAHAEVNARAKDQATPLYAAAQEGHHEVCKLLLQGQAEVNARNQDQYTPLHAATEEGQHEVCKLLLQAQAEVNARNQDQLTSLHVAAREGHHEVCKLLLHAQAEVNARAKCQNTPLHFAAQRGHRNVYELLLQNGADEHAKNKYQATPLHVAAQEGHHEVCKLLLQAQAEVNARCQGQVTPLHVAAQEGHHEVCKLLLQAQAEVNARTRIQNTPLHIAAELGHRNVCELLLLNGADEHAKNEAQNTPLHFAALRGHRNIYELLLQKGADEHAKNKWNKSPDSIKAIVTA